MTSKFGCRLMHVGLLTSAPAMLVLSTPASAQAEIKKFDIPAQPLSSALLEFSRQSDVLVVVAPELAAGKRSRALKGSMPANEAIGILLSGSHLRATPNPKGGYIIQGQSRASAEGNAPKAVTDSTASSGEATAGSAAAGNCGHRHQHSWGPEPHCSSPQLRAGGNRPDWGSHDPRLSSNFDRELQR